MRCFSFFHFFFFFHSFLITALYLVACTDNARRRKITPNAQYYTLPCFSITIIQHLRYHYYLCDFNRRISLQKLCSRTKKCQVALIS